MFAHPEVTWNILTLNFLSDNYISLLDPHFPSSYCLAFFMDTEYHHISVNPSFLPFCLPPFSPLLDCNHSHFPRDHSDSVFTFSVWKQQPHPSQRSWMFARTTKLSLKAWSFHMHLDYLEGGRSDWLHSYVALKGKAVFWFGWAVRNLKRNTM